MSMTKKCQQLWLKAMKEPVILKLPSKYDLNRARLALYNSMKHISGKADLIEAKRVCEMTTDRKNLTLTIQRKDLNPFYDAFAAAVDNVLVEDGETKAGEINIEDSLEKLREKLGESGKTEAERPINPYFKREGN